jgi:hypothetical protein
MARTRSCTAATATLRCAYIRCTGNSFRYSARKSAARRTASSYRAITVARVGLLYASSTGHTRAAAHLVKQCLGEIVSDPMQVSRVSARELVSCAEDDGAVILGAPTWATGCSRMRTGTAMDDFLWQVSSAPSPPRTVIDNDVKLLQVALRSVYYPRHSNNGEPRKGHFSQPARTLTAPTYSIAHHIFCRPFTEQVPSSPLLAKLFSLSKCLDSLPFAFRVWIK